MQVTAEKATTAVIDQAKEIASKVSETVQSAVENVMPAGESK